MGYAEKRGGYWRGRYKIEDGKYGTVADSTGVVVKFATKREAKQAADAEEVTVRRGHGGRVHGPLPLLPGKLR